MEKTEAEADVRESEENVLKQAALVAKLEEHGLLELAAQASEVLRYLESSLQLSLARLQVERAVRAG
jgi:predicted transcriptional regulator YheO